MISISIRWLHPHKAPTALSVLRTDHCSRRSHLCRTLSSHGVVQDIADRFEGQNVLVVSHGEVRIADAVRATRCG